ncbi:Ribosome biogenesis protein rlp24 [Dissostichus eleginoides]|uniref:Ribosome biogenesis protein rlp24 n=1 Tax=Dissostichus eleginoides TaxID=100907 RepID=A0AAD9CFG6_DISEL|nr:Ribosome biogenesis protein rlp24 [Dissostichus eleginoides]
MKKEKEKWLLFVLKGNEAEQNGRLKRNPEKRECKGDAGLRSGSAGRRVPSDQTQNQGGSVMKGTKRVTLNHSQAHSDPSCDPSPGIPLPGRPSPGFSSPQDHDSGSS